VASVDVKQHKRKKRKASVPAMKNNVPNGRPMDNSRGRLPLVQGPKTAIVIRDLTLEGCIFID